MAIREKLRAKFSKNKTSSSTSSQSNDTPIPGHYTGRTDIEYYKPHEIPKSKYRGRVDPLHKEKLDSFNFGDSFTAVRRASAALSGTFSPGGTKAFSRRTSYASNIDSRTPARSRRSSLSSDANASFSVPSSESASTYVRSTPSAGSPAEPTLRENSDDDTDVTNSECTSSANVHRDILTAFVAGLSKLDTVQESRPQSRSNGNIPSIRLDRQATVPDTENKISNRHIEHSSRSTDLPFTPEQLTQAITSATITPSATARRTSVFVA